MHIPRTMAYSPKLLTKQLIKLMELTLWPSDYCNTHNLDTKQIESKYHLVWKRAKVWHSCIQVRAIRHCLIRANILSWQSKTSSQQPATTASKCLVWTYDVFVLILGPWLETGHLNSCFQNLPTLNRCYCSHNTKSCERTHTASEARTLGILGFF